MMSRRLLACAFVRIARVLITVTVALGCRPVLSLAYGPLPTPQPVSPPSAAPLDASARPEGMVVVDQATLQQLFTRLEAAEAEIRSLRQQNRALNGPGNLRPLPPVANFASAANAAVAKPAPPKADKPKFPKYLAPVVTKCGDITFKPGLRLQQRYTYDDLTDNNDFFVRRFRLKAGGNAFGIAKYYGELKFDSNSRFESETKGVVENAWLEFTLAEGWAYLRIGLYDLPFSRNALTSDSKLLFMDRTLIKSALTNLGLADNTVGLLLHGRPFHGRLEYAVGIFDSVKFEKVGANGTLESDHLMPAGRIVLHLLDPATPADGYADYRESYIGQGERLAIGAHSAYLRNAMDNGDEFDVYGWGVDLFCGFGPITFQGEYDWFMEDMTQGNPDVKGDGWYIQAGYLLGYLCHCAIELAARYQELDPEKDVLDDRLQWTSVGLNLYVREHHLKIQTEYIFKTEQGDEIANDMFQMQLQMDY